MSGDRGWYVVALGILALGLNPIGRIDKLCVNTLRARAQTALLRAEMQADRYFAAARFALTGELPVRQVVIPQMDVESVRAQAEQARVVALAQAGQCLQKRQMMIDAARVKADVARQILIEPSRLGPKSVTFVGPMNMPQVVTEFPRDDDGTI
jgi:hypothetical protein